ncbi:Ctr copper transporter [Hymenopellis radicata]|nr:Ctr copper transporter [Hymenopellis radicata]
MDHGNHDMPMRCSMNMLWNIQIQNTCIVFRSWHIHSNAQFVLSLVIIALLGVAYEYLRVLQRKLDSHITSFAPRSHARSPSRSREDATLLGGKAVSGAYTSESRFVVPPTYRLLRALLYGLAVFVSFFLMLVFMTYNAYLILAVVVGATIGHYAFNPELLPQAGDKGMACH